MDKLTLSLLVALGIAVLDIIPMLIQRLPAYSTIASFIHYFVATILIMNVDIPLLPW
ncbi:MAG: hypothetical protein LUD74_03895 [Tannerellaceae bacterium]|nr:hypothetical protein [Tannerellaceae bacterium]